MKKLNIVYLLMLLLILSGCGSENRENINTLTTEQDTSVSNKGNVSSNIDAEELVNHSSKVKIDLSLINDNIKELPVLNMGVHQFDFEETKNIFLGETTTSKEEWENEFGPAVSYVNDTGDELEIYKGYIKYTTELGRHMRSVFNPKTSSISSTKSKELVNLIKTVKDQELTFSSQDNIIKEGVELCKKLGISVSANRPSVYALEYDKINKIQDQLLKEDFFLKDFEEKLLDESDSCYYIAFEVEENGISVDPSGYTSQSTRELMNGSYIIMIVSANGIEYFEVSGLIYEKKEPAIENKTLLPIQTCLDKYISKYDNDILVKNVSVDDIKLCYVPIPTKDSENVIFEPSWMFYSGVDVIIDEQSGNIRTMGEVVRIDAITGKEIM